MPLPPLVRIMGPSPSAGPAASSAAPEGALYAVVVAVDLLSMEVELQGGVVAQAGTLATSVPLRAGDGVLVLAMPDGTYEVLGRAS